MKKITLLLVALLATMATFATTLYLKPNANWKKDNARFAVYFFGNGEKWVDMTLTANETDIYQVEAPAGYPSVIFCRMNPGTKDNNWNNKWNQTADLKVPTNENTLYTVTENTWDKGGGTWSKYAIAGEPYVKFNNSSSAQKGDTFIPNVTCENIENPTYTYTVSYNGGETIECPSTGYLLADYGKYEFIVEVKSNGEGNVIAFATIEVRVAYDAYVAGTHNGWSQDNDDHGMIADENGILVKTYNQMASGTYSFKVVYKGDWMGFDKVNTTESIQCEEGTNDNGDKNGNISFTLTKTSDVTIYYNSTAEKPISIKTDGASSNPSINITDGTKLYLNPSEEWKVGGARFAAYFFGGDGELWLNMTDTNNDGIYEVTCQGSREKVIFCRMNPEFTDNGWNQGNEDETGSPKRVWNQTSDLTYDGTNNQYNVSGWDNGNWSVFSGSNNGGNDNNDPEKPQPEASIYTLCGASTIFGSEWDETDTNNDMTKGEDGIWTKEYTGVTLTKGSYEYKVVADHNWETPGKYPSDETNMTLYIAKDGKYNILFTFDPTIPELKAVATNAEDPVNVDNIAISNLYVHNGTIHAEADITIYSITGQNVTNLNGNLKNGVYIVKSTNATTKVVLK